MFHQASSLWASSLRLNLWAALLTSSTTMWSPSQPLRRSLILLLWLWHPMLSSFVVMRNWKRLSIPLVTTLVSALRAVLKLKAHTLISVHSWISWNSTTIIRSMLCAFSGPHLPSLKMQLPLSVNMNTTLTLILLLPQPKKSNLTSRLAMERRSKVSRTLSINSWNLKTREEISWIWILLKLTVRILKTGEFTLVVNKKSSKPFWTWTLSLVMLSAFFTQLLWREAVLVLCHTSWQLQLDRNLTAAPMVLSRANGTLIWRVRHLQPSLWSKSALRVKLICQFYLCGTLKNSVPAWLISVTPMISVLEGLLALNLQSRLLAVPRYLMSKRNLAVNLLLLENAISSWKNVLLVPNCQILVNVLAFKPKLLMRLNSRWNITMFQKKWLVLKARLLISWKCTFGLILRLSRAQSKPKTYFKRKTVASLWCAVSFSTVKHQALIWSSTSQNSLLPFLKSVFLIHSTLSFPWRLAGTMPTWLWNQSQVHLWHLNAR